MTPKQLSCMDEEISLEIAKATHEDKNDDLVITISFTRTYVFTNTEEIDPITRETISTESLSEARISHVNLARGWAMSPSSKLTGGS